MTDRFPRVPVRLILASAISLGFTPFAWAVQTDAPPAKPSPELNVETVARGLVNPWGLQFLPDGRMLVTERPGRLRIVSADGKLSEPVPGVPGVDARGQGGLLDVRLAPDFAQSSNIYFSFSEPRTGGKNSTSVARGRLALEEKSARIEGLSVIWRQEPAVASTAHFGSRMAFRRDGTLFVTTGDRFDRRDDAQNPANELGKIIRMNSDGSVPEGNPAKEGWGPHVWSIGHRNVQGAAIDPATDKLWTVAHGARGGDELNSPEAGKNYGWPVISYGVDYSGAKIGEGTEKAGMEQPIYYWDPSIAISGLSFYTGDLFPEWKGNLFAGALEGTHLTRLVLENGTVAAEEQLLAAQGERIRDVRQGPDGALYVLTDARDGKILKLTPKR